MSCDMFLGIDGIDGESADGTFENKIDICSWHWGMSQSGTTHMGPGAGAGKVSVSDMVIDKYIDKSSPVLMKYCAKGTHISECELTVRKAGDTPLEYIKITMNDCIISEIQTGGTGDEDRLMETVRLNFAKHKVVYTPQKADGSGDAAVESTWDTAANQE